jgi:hypothetical protein
LRSFLSHLLSFLLLPAVLLGGGEAVLLGSGELWSIDRVLAYLRRHPNAIYLRATDQSFYAYKYHGILDKNPAILVVGSSRTMKFRAPMFGDRSSSFYNAGGMVNGLRDLHDFALLLPGSRTPRVLLVGVDLWWFNPRVPPAFDFASEAAKDAAASFDAHVVGLRWLIRHPGTFADEAISIARSSRPEAIGIGARTTGGGFRPDGSFKSPLPAPRSEREWAYVDREVPPIIERVRNAVANFPAASSLAADRLALLDLVLARYRQKRVFVIGYLPPFSSEVLTQLETDGRHSHLWSAFRQRMPEMFAAHGFPLIDASDAASIGMDDRALSDGFHGEETFQVHVLKALLQDERIRAVLPGAEAALDRALASPRTNYWEADLGS